MKRILIIPHHPGLSKIKIRLIEVAKALSLRYEIYLVNWNTALGNYSFKLRFLSALKNTFARSKLYKRDNINIIEFPILHRPLSIALKFNSYWLKNIIDSYNIDTVINGSLYMFKIPQKGKFKYIFDIADIPFINDDYFDKFVDCQLKVEFEQVDAITTVSNGLVHYISDNYQKKAFFVPNGADIEKIRSVSQEDIDKLRKRYNLYGKWIIGYIGQIGHWVNTELTVKVFKKVKEYIPDALLFWVGLSPNIKKLKRLYGNDDVIFTGGVDEDIEPYFNLLDIGILPHKKNLFQDLAFHLKLIEYSAARKFVVSTPLEETKSMNFPNIFFASENTEEWVRSIKKAKSMQWQKEWDNLVKDYAWPEIAKTFMNIIEE